MADGARILTGLSIEELPFEAQARIHAADLRAKRLLSEVRQEAFEIWARAEHRNAGYNDLDVGGVRFARKWARDNIDEATVGAAVIKFDARAQEYWGVVKEVLAFKSILRNIGAMLLAEFGQLEVISRAIEFCTSVWEEKAWLAAGQGASPAPEKKSKSRGRLSAADNQLYALVETSIAHLANDELVKRYGPELKKLYPNRSQSSFRSSLNRIRQAKGIPPSADIKKGENIVDESTNLGHTKSWPANLRPYRKP